MYPSSPICKGGVRQSANQTTKKSSGAIRPASVSITQSPASIRQSDNHMDQSSNQTITWTNQAIRQSHGPIRQSDNHVDQSGNQTIGMVVIQSMRKSGHQTTNRSTKARRRGKEAIRINQSDNHANKPPCNQAITRWSRCEAYPKATLMIQDSPPVVDSGQLAQVCTAPSPPYIPMCHFRRARIHTTYVSILHPRRPSTPNRPYHNLRFKRRE